jgi:hypothetical protein
MSGRLRRPLSVKANFTVTSFGSLTALGNIGSNCHFVTAQTFHRENDRFLAERF